MRLISLCFVGSDVDLEGLAYQLQAGSPEERGAAAERLFSHAAENERNRSHVASLGVVQPLVSCLVHSLCPWISLMLHILM